MRSAIAIIGLLTVITASEECRRKDKSIPAPPAPEPIVVTELPLPPVAPSDAIGACTPAVNPRRTGCMSLNQMFQCGGFMPDGLQVLALVSFSGAPPPPDPASIYSGLQIIVVKTDGTTFPSGDPWKCITCAVPATSRVGENDELGYPQAFRDGTRLLVGTNIIDCGGAQITAEECTPERTFIYPLRWNVNADGSGVGGNMRELRLHPDNVHLVFNAFGAANGQLTQTAYFCRLEFNPSPTVGMPLAPRYDLVNVTVLFNPSAPQPITAIGSHLHINSSAIAIGEARGFNGKGTELLYIGYPAESCNMDLFAVDLATGAVRRLTSHPEYADPVDVSPVDDWMVIMDTRGSGRQMWMAGMQHVPPITDMISTAVSASTRNNGQRRFFQPYLLDRYGDRGGYFGQKVNGHLHGVPGSGAIDDPEWNGGADPRWSPDGTRIVFYQVQTISPACGGANPLPCYPSREAGGRNVRLMLATLTSREPVAVPSVEPVSDVIPWGTPYVSGSSLPMMPQISPGNYTLSGKASGVAEVEIIYSSNTTAHTIAVNYRNFSDDGIHFLDGTESVSVVVLNLTRNHIDWYSDLKATGGTTASKKTSEDGFHLDIDIHTNIFEATGTLTTFVNGSMWLQPLNGA